MRDDWGRDWGSLERFDRYYPDATAATVDTETATRSGLWKPGTLRVYSSP